MSREKLVAFLRAAGADRAKSILSRLPPQEAQAIREALEQSPNVPAGMVDQVADAAATFVATVSHKR
ncbi:hypothetical protein [Ferrovibrio sp.]|uniref:hypothetical protein n=1 Tax=Ferrovibrio sp. TaxID=1917215 RepID=UPI0025B875D5|nr:hypothetical protein [Ferrovibrio sp.]MBX3454079.1 hypothetical protein [Ferrovibrio sp.]